MSWLAFNRFQNCAFSVVVHQTIIGASGMKCRVVELPWREPQLRYAVEQEWGLGWAIVESFSDLTQAKEYLALFAKGPIVHGDVVDVTAFECRSTDLAALARP